MESPRLVQIIYGEGSGKTTMALGKALRAHGNGLRVAVIQFMKSGTAWWKEENQDTGEVVSLRTLGIEVYSFGRAKFVDKPVPLDYELTDTAFKKAGEIEPIVDVLILDELLNAVSFGLIKIERVTEFIEKRRNTELILTGRQLAEEIRTLSDQITHVFSEEHPFSNGVPARKGFEY